MKDLMFWVCKLVHADCADDAVAALAELSRLERQINVDEVPIVTGSTLTLLYRVTRDKCGADEVVGAYSTSAALAAAQARITTSRTYTRTFVLNAMPIDWRGQTLGGPL